MAKIVIFRKEIFIFIQIHFKAYLCSIWVKLPLKYLEDSCNEVRKLGFKFCKTNRKAIMLVSGQK